MIVGLTGSIAMGKSTTADMFEKLGYPVFDADKQVHRLYRKGGQAAKQIGQIFPDVMTDGAVNRQLLAAKISKNKTVLPRIEKIVHPMVRALEKQFISDRQKANSKLIILDIPLLFETGRVKDVDIVIVVSATEKQQRQRALQRPGMTREKLDVILARQMPDKEKRRRADYVINTDKSLEDTFEQVKTLINGLISPANQLEL